MNITIQYQCGNNFSYCHSYEVELSPGVYFFQVFGSSGGDSNLGGRIDLGGKGGFSSGYFYAIDPMSVFVYVGSSGGFDYYTSVEGGWNGGGSSTRCGASGGGATDIRTIGGEWNNQESLLSRLIVAGGGSGAYGGSTCHATGADGGGENGNKITSGISCSGVTFPDVCVGSQSGCVGGGSSQTRGGLGYGGGYSELYSPGGGGGYYGGGSGVRGAGGGSGFIGGVSSYQTNFPYMERGVNYGNGFAIITLIRAFNPCHTQFRFMFISLITITIPALFLDYDK